MKKVLKLVTTKRELKIVIGWFQKNLLVIVSRYLVSDFLIRQKPVLMMMMMMMMMMMIYIFIKRWIMHANIKLQVGGACWIISPETGN